MSDRLEPRRIAFMSERMRLGFGVDLVIDELAKKLVQRGHDVTVYASVIDKSDREYKLEQIPTRASGVPMRYESAARWWADYVDAKRHEVVFVESFPFFSLIPHLRTPTIAVDHGVSETKGMSARQRLAFRYIEWTQHHRYFPRAAGVITVSEYVRSLLPRRLQPRTLVVYNGADHHSEAPRVASQAMRARLGIDDGETMVLYVGRLNPEGQPYKGTADLIRMCHDLRERESNVRFVMAGTGSEVDAGRIRWAGGIPLLDVPDEEMPSLFAAADLYVTASRWEGFDLPLVEAAYQGVPCVALNVGAHPEVARDGETGILANNVDDLRAAVERLVDDRASRQRMGEAARTLAQQFTWARATDGYEAALTEVAPLVRKPSAVPSAADATSQAIGVAREPAARELDTAAERTPDVTAVVLNYGASFDVLQRCIDSIAVQTAPVHILLVDNGSPKNRDAVDRIAQLHPEMELLQLKKNYGFAGGMNRGVAACRTEYVLLLNNDVTLTPKATEEMRKLIDGAEDVVGIAPKILLEDPPGYIDAIGNLVDGVGQAYNMGIGQLDVGQYDRVEATFGACFAATLLRREAFAPGLVGPLDETYFMYYEDVDWCFRAGVLGYKFLVCPSAIVQHMHSMTTRELAYGFKYRMIMRNLVRTLIKDFQGRRAYKLAVRRCLGLTRNVVRGPYRWPSFLALKDVALGFPRYWARRRAIQGRRRVDDQALFNFSHGETGFFDPTGYQPIRSLEALHAMYRRLYLLTGEERHRAIADMVATIATSRLRFDRDAVLAKLRPLFASEPAYAQDYMEALAI